MAFRQLLDCLRIVALIALRDALAASAALLEEGRFCWLKADLCTETPWMRKFVRFISCHICCKTMFFFEVSVSYIFFQLASPTSNVTAIARTPRPLQMRMWRKVLMRFWRQDTWRFATPLDKKASLLFLDMLLGSVFLNRSSLCEFEIWWNTSWIVESKGIDIPRIDEIDGLFSKLRDPH